VKTPEAPVALAGIKEGRKRRKKEEKALSKERRPLEGRERLRVLTDLVGEERKLIETADHKARFAFVIMGAVNLALLVFGTREQVIASIPAGAKSWLAALLVPYGVLTFSFCLWAVEVLRPHVGEYAAELAEARRREQASGQPGLEDAPLGLFHWTDILRKDPKEYERLWSEVRLGQVNAELSMLAHALAHVNDAQYKALHRLYRGLQLLTVLAAMVMGLLGVFAFR
jgi:hypothetical protein